MKNSIFTILTISLIGLLVFFYQQNLKKSWELADIVTTTTKVVDEQLTVIQESVKQINNAWDELQSTSQMSNLIKNSKEEMTLAKDGDFYVYENKKIGFLVKLPNNIFSNNPADNLTFGDDQTVILLFNGKYKNYPLHVAMLIDNDSQDCWTNESSELKINDIIFRCDKPSFDDQSAEYHIGCYTIKDNWCFKIEYIVGDIKSISLPVEIAVENLLLKNINFVSSN